MRARCSLAAATVLGALIAATHVQGEQDAETPASKVQVLWQFEAGG